MRDYSEYIMESRPEGDQIFVFWLGGTGYIIKSQNVTIGIDLYLSDSCRGENDSFKRLIPVPVEVDSLCLDYLIATHEHGDHFDTAILHNLICERTKTRLIGTTTVTAIARGMGIKADRLITLNRNQSVNLSGIRLRGVLADHGEYSPDAIGVIIEIENKSIYFTGDTCYRPDLPQLIPIDSPVEILIVPINGKFGNPDAKDAAYYTAWVKPASVMPCHFWMFKEHGGDPGEFMECCLRIAPDAKIVIPAVGEKCIF